MGGCCIVAPAIIGGHHSLTHSPVQPHITAGVPVFKNVFHALRYDNSAGTPYWIVKNSELILLGSVSGTCP